MGRSAPAGIVLILLDFKHFCRKLCLIRLMIMPVAAIGTFWIYPGAAESEGAAKVGLKQ